MELIQRKTDSIRGTNACSRLVRCTRCTNHNQAPAVVRRGAPTKHFVVDECAHIPPNWSIGGGGFCCGIVQHTHNRYDMIMSLRPENMRLSSAFLCTHKSPNRSSRNTMLCRIFNTIFKLTIKTTTQNTRTAINICLPYEQKYHTINVKLPHTETAFAVLPQHVNI